MRVLYDTRERHFDQNPYLSLLRESMSPTVEVLGFSWKRALLGRYDLVHVHWPEYVLRPGRRWLRPLAAVATELWLRRLAANSTPVIRTVHDLRPLVSLSRSEERLLARLERLTSARIWLTEPAGLPGAPRIEAGDAVIPHGDYLPWLREQADGAAAAAPERALATADVPELLCFGILRPYKRFEQVITAVAELPPENRVHLRVLGSAPSPEYLVALLRAAGAAPARVEMVARRASDPELYAALLAADLVVVPYEELYNSGVVLLALSAQRPVALRDSVISRALQAEFGPSWVSLWPGDLDAGKLTAVLAVAREPRATLDIERSRGWESVGGRHRAFYGEVRAALDAGSPSLGAQDGLPST